MPGLDTSRQFIPLKIAVLTVSDTRSLDEDKSGATLAELIEKAGHTVGARAVVTDDVDGGIGDPRLHAGADLLNVVGDDRAVADRVAGLGDALDQGRAGLVAGEIAGIGNRQHRDLQRHELPAFVDSGHGASVAHTRTGCTHSCAEAKVLQLPSLPDWKPVMNQRWRCSALPCVKESGTT